MRIIDLILLLNDFNRNNRIFIEDNKQNYSVVDLEIESSGVYLKTSSKLNGIKNWEFLLLINKKEYYELPIFFDTKKDHHQLFGFRVSDDRILLG
ncbi:hypothetical protein M5C72_03235 [Companilactobacillus allii]|uniref:Uncharacterized protein n=1 Tax=Companilactobacillus allii TaxID=1847728 RepID=A0A1P8Q2U9_9LACO|nr:hypothetical protein [Companilactobacillus allii]APX72165.1 hypothetical protein BTM29_06160 [Companilactobacillus allii]USQ69262.1 hypothetical protein M5C72_03235 [Companilactobacillus allii]